MRISDEAKLVMFVLAVILTIIFLISWSIYSIEKNITQECSFDEEYTPGQIVSSVLDGRKGMIISKACKSYEVRFSSETAYTKTHMLGSGGKIDKGFYSMEFMRPFEIQPVQ